MTRQTHATSRSAARTALFALALASLLLGSLGGCLPLTFSNDGEIDFESYPVLYVPPILDPDGFRTPADAYMEGTARSYLVDELRSMSGFQRITVLPDEPADLVLHVYLDVWEEYSEESDYYDDGTVVTYEDAEYYAEAEFQAETADGSLIVIDGIVEDSSGTMEETIEDTLDELAYFFLRPYRI